MSNGRSFTRNRKGSPEKSRRKAQQRQTAQWKFQGAIDRAAKSAVEAASGAIDQLADSLVAAAGITKEEAVEQVTDVVEAFEDAAE